MIDIQEIRSLGVAPELVQFAEFLIEEKGDRVFPDYRTLNLMKIPALVPYVWVFDFRNGTDDGFLYHFAGSKIDEYFGFSVTGHTFEHCYSGKYQAQLIRNVHDRVLLEQKIGFSLRLDVLKYEFHEKMLRVEALSFPCSSDDKNVNFGIGITIYSHAIEDFGPIFRVL